MNSNTTFIKCGDSADLISEDIPKKSVHAVITDPQYAIELMNLNWDRTLPDISIWRQCYDVLRPGGFCIVFSHTRMFHKIGLHLEESGFEIRDCLCWAYASGFPHSMDISKAIDNKEGVERKVIGKRIHPTLKNNPKVDSNVYHVDTLKSHNTMESWDITEPATPMARQWCGWGTQLKTSWEAIILARKPLEGTYIENILKYKVGALNIDECRIPYASDEDRKSLESFMNFEGVDHGDERYFSGNIGGKKQVNVHPDGRWPANLLWLDPLFADYDHIFMVPKPNQKEKREYNNHESVKPIRLMERLIKLVTPRPSVVQEDVVVLDPFMGSGSTGVACKKLGRKFIGFEKDEESFKTAQKRLSEPIGTRDIFEI